VSACGGRWYSQQQLRAIVRWVKSDTLLRTKDQLLAEVMNDLGFQEARSAHRRDD